jgi:hypothetical protein
MPWLHHVEPAAAALLGDEGKRRVHRNSTPAGLPQWSCSVVRAGHCAAHALHRRKGQLLRRGAAYMPIAAFGSSPAGHRSLALALPGRPARFLLVQGLVLSPLGTLRLPGLLLYGARAGLAVTPRARARLWQAQVQTFAASVPYHTITVLLGEAGGARARGQAHLCT